MWIPRKRAELASLMPSTGMNMPRCISCRSIQATYRDLLLHTGQPGPDERISSRVVGIPRVHIHTRKKVPRGPIGLPPCARPGVLDTGPPPVVERDAVTKFRESELPPGAQEKLQEPEPPQKLIGDTKKGINEFRRGKLDGRTCCAILNIVIVIVTSP